MLDRTFLEEWPLYRKFSFHFPVVLAALQLPSVNMHCATCESHQTYVPQGREGKDPKWTDGMPHTLHLLYWCMSCRRTGRDFLLHIDVPRENVWKAGQWPAWTPPGGEEGHVIFGDHAGLYRRGLVLESQGYGIGAFAYYRRIVEGVIDELLGHVPDLLSGEELAKYNEALEKTRKTKVAAEKIALVKDLLPPILRPDSINPLSLLHEVLSAGLHVEDEEECLARAMTVREGLVFLLRQVEASRESAKTFTDGMRKLLERKSQQGS